MTGWPDLAGRLVDGDHVLPVRVYYEDTDFTGVVYHGAFVRFIERGRSDFVRLIGIHHSELEGGVHGARLAFAVRGMTFDFAKPARIDDLLEIRTSIISFRGARIVFDQKVLRGEDTLVAAEVTVAIITQEGRPTRLPKALSDKMLPYIPAAGM